MSAAIVMKLGWYPPIRSAVWAFAFAGMGYYGAFLSTSDGAAEPDGAVLWFVGVIVALFVLGLLHSLWQICLGRPIATLSPEGLRARACDNVLIPWELVTSVTLAGEQASMALSTSSAAPLIEALTRHDAYEVLLDPKVLEHGVKHSGNLLSIGFKLVPLKLNLSSRAIAEAFARYLPPERCIGFGHSHSPETARDYVARGAMAAAAVALGTMERMEAEQSSSGDLEPSNQSESTPDP